jgi:hypothetical protein
MVVRSYNPSTQESEVRGLAVSGHPWLRGDTLSQKTNNSGKKKRKKKKRKGREGKEALRVSKEEAGS